MGCICGVWKCLDEIINLIPFITVDSPITIIAFISSLADKFGFIVGSEKTCFETISFKLFKTALASEFLSSKIWTPLFVFDSTSNFLIKAPIFVT